MSEPVERAMILAAGLGTRLRPLTEHVPKPLVPVAGRPLLANVIVNLRRAGVSRVAVNAHHLHHQVSEFCEGFAGSGEVSLFHEPRILGTGGALVNAKSFFSGGGPFFLHNADVLTDLDLAALARDHAVSGALATLALADWAPENKVLMGPGGEVADIAGLIGAPAAGRGLWTYTGVAVLSPELFEFLPPKGRSSLIDGLIRAIRARPGSVRGFAPKPLYWNDLGTLKRYRNAHEDVLLRGVLTLPGIEIAGGIHVSRGASIGDDVGCEGFVSICAGAVIADGARLTDCVVLPGARVGEEEAVEDEVVGRDFRIAFGEIAARDRAVLSRRGFGPEAQLAPLVEQGSDRQFFRVSEEGRHEVLMISPPDDPDLKRYLAIGKYLHERGLGVPEILEADEADGSVVVEDLGDGILYLAARQEGDLGVLSDLYGRVIDLLVAFQTAGTRDIISCPEAGERALDYEAFRWETSYFRDNALERVLGFGTQELGGLDEEFHALAEAAASQPRVLAHRDFQSQNIILKDGRARVVDFQGARLGPAAYDLASLLRDAYVDLPRELRGMLLERYRTASAAAGGESLSAGELHDRFVVAGLQRNMQALGAFGFLWLVKGKSQFKKFLAPGFAHLRAGLRELKESGIALGPLPRLTAVAAKAAKKLN